MKTWMKRLYGSVAVVTTVVVPELIMDGEDGNLLVRVVMMAVMAASFWLMGKIISFFLVRYFK